MKNAVKNPIQSCFAQFSALGDTDTIGGGVLPYPSLQGLQNLQGMGIETDGIPQCNLIVLHKGRDLRCIQTKSGEKDFKPLPAHLRPGKGALFQQLPVSPIDLRIGGDHVIGTQTDLKI